MTVDALQVGFIGTNCYIAYDDSTMTAVIIDPGFEAERIIAAVKDGYSVKAVLITHPHYDHFSACKKVSEHFDADVYCDENAVEIIENSENSRGMAVCLNSAPQIESPIGLSDGEKIKIGNMEITSVYTPGHCEGSCCFIAGDCIFAGDCLFRENIGRCDLPTGDIAIMLSSLKKLKTVFDSQGDKTVYSGHGESSSLSHEIRYNPYFEYALRV